MSDKHRPFARMLIACFLFVFAVALNIFLPRYWRDIPEIVKHLLLMFSAIMCVHIIEYAYLWWEIFGHIKGILQETLQATNQLIDDNRGSLERVLQDTNRLIRSAANCGLTDIYDCRKDVKSDIYNTIENAEKRVWLLGITFSENVHLDQLLSTLSKKIQGGLDIRMLLLDTLRGPAIFRAFLEGTALETARIIHTDRTKVQPMDPYFHQRIYSDFVHACNRLRSHPTVGATVRFYAQTPVCWMTIVDDVIYFQPYTLGRSANQHSVNVCIGAHMPVFKFQMQSHGKPFEILEDHFFKLWLTSNMDLFHVETRIADRNHIIKDIFDSHLSWFKHVYGSLYAPKEGGLFPIDRRKFPRQLWVWGQLTSLSICLQDNKTIDAAISDYSCEALSLKMENTYSLYEGERVALQGIPPVEPLAANFVMDHFLKIGEFVVKRIENSPQPVAALQAILKSNRCEELNKD